MGEMAEWFKAHAWKACKEVILSWVRIPFSPPSKKPIFSTLITQLLMIEQMISKQIF